MQHLQDDLGAVFYGPDFAATFTRTRPGAASVNVALILGIADDDALEGRAIAVQRTAQMPASCDVRADDLLEATGDLPGTGITAGQRFRVLDMPRRINDGLELEALLGSVSP